MPDDTSVPLGFFPNSRAKADRYINPFYGIPLQYLPLSLESMLWWADHFLLRFGFYRAAIYRIANYFITSVSVDCDDEEAKKQYEEAFEKLYWKEVCATAGMNLIGYGNTYVTINQGFNRFLTCPKCQKTSLIDRVDDYKFSNKGIFTMQCKNPQCKFNGAHQISDKLSRDIDKLNVVFWPPKEIKVRYEETTAASEYYWDYPASYVSKITRPNDKFFSKRTPKVIYDAVFEKKLISFNPSNFLHLKFPTPAGIRTDGRAVPPCIYMFDDFFMLKVLQRFNEAICFEDINPFRVIAMSPESNQQANPILNQNASVWTSAVNRMIDEHRLDPGAYHTFPFPLAYQQLGGQGKQLAPVELIQLAIQNILNALNVPQELYVMNFKEAAIGPALRLFENSWSMIPDNYNRLLQHWADVIGKIQGLPKANVKLLPITLSDDMERKSIIAQLVSANSIAKSELLNLYGFDYREQLRKRMQEDKDLKELTEEEQIKDQLKQQQQSFTMGGQEQQVGGTPGDVVAQAQEIAQQLFPLGPAERRSQLQQIKAQNQTLYGAVKQSLEEMTSSAKSQGVQQAQQQSQQPQ